MSVFPMPPWRRLCGVAIALAVLATARPADAIVDMKNANYSQTWVDLVALSEPDRPRRDREASQAWTIDLGVERSYNSRSLHDGLFGFGWCSDFETRLRPTPEGNAVLVFCGGGEEVSFEREGYDPAEAKRLAARIVERLREAQARDPRSLSSLLGGLRDSAWDAFRRRLEESDPLRLEHARRLGLVRAPREGERLRPSAGGMEQLVVEADGWRHVFGGGAGTRFDRDGQLRALLGADGVALRLERVDGRIARAERSDGRGWLRFEWTREGKVAALERSDGLRTTYRYTRDDLVSVRNGWGNEYLHEYDDRHNLTRTTFPDGSYIRLGYDRERDWVVNYRDREGCIEDYAYGFLRGADHYIARINKQCGSQITADSTHEFIYSKNARGERYLSDVRSRINEQVVEHTYHEAYNRPTRILRDGVVTEWEYDSRGRVRERRQGSRHWAFEYEREAGRPARVIERELRGDGSEALRRDLATDPWPGMWNPGRPSSESSSWEPREVSEMQAAFTRMRSAGRYAEAADALEAWSVSAGGRAEAMGLVQLAMTLGFDRAHERDPVVAERLFRVAYRVAARERLQDVYTALEWTGRSLWNQGRRADAASAFAEAVAAIEADEGPRSARLAAMLDRLAGAWRELGQYAAAYEAHVRAEGIRGSLDAAAEDSIAGLLGDVGLFERQRELFRDSLRVLEASVAAAREHHGDTVLEVARLFGRLGEHDKAIVLLERQVEDETRAFGSDTPRVASLRSELATELTFAGRYDEAGPLFDAAVTRLDAAGSQWRGTLAGVLNNQALFHGWLGQAARQRELLERVLVLLGEGDRSPAAATTLGNLGAALVELGQAGEALPRLEEALALRRAAYPAAHWRIGALLGWIGRVHLVAGEFSRAVRVLEEAAAMLEVALGAGHHRTAVVVTLLAEARLAAGDGDGARAAAHRALESALRSGSDEALWQAQYRAAEIYARAGRPAVAILLGKEAVTTLQALRRRVARLSSEAQRTYAGSREGVYRALADRLIDAGRLAEAQQVLAMLKEEELFDFVRRDDSANPGAGRPSVTAAEAPWSQRYAALGAELATVGARRDELAQKAKIGLTVAERAQLAELETAFDAARRGLVGFLDDLNRELGALDARRQAEIARRDLEGLEAYQDDLRALGPGVVMLHYVSLRDRLRIIVTTADLQVGRASEVSAVELNRQVQALRGALGKERGDARPAARRLHETLLAPIADLLARAGAHTLLLSLDGPLRYVPFAALHDGERWLVEAYRTVVLTEAAKGRLGSAPRAKGRFVGLGLTRALPGFSALPEVRTELEGIVGSGSVQGELHFDDDFTAERVRRSLGGTTSVLHLASHFVFRPGTETESFLVLGDSNRLTLRDLRVSGYSFRGLDLLTLSACETAVGGGADANGREIEGFGALAQQRGARAVMATLWPVVDESTGLLMRLFYARLTQEGSLSKAEALRQSQLALLKGERGADSSAAATRGMKRATEHADAGAATPGGLFAHPYFWAPFILMGNGL